MLFFLDPVNIALHPEEIEEAIKQLEESLKTGIPLNEDDIHCIILMLFIKTINPLVFKKIILNVYLTDLEI